MKKSSWFRGAAVALGLAVGGMLYGQSANPQTYEVKTPQYRTIDGILAQDINSYINRLPRDENIEFNLGPNVKYFSAIDPILVIKEKINYLKNDPRAKAFYASQSDPWYLSIPGASSILGKKKTNTKPDEARLRDIRTYEQLLSVVSKEPRTAEYYKSLKQLSKSLGAKDNVLTIKELEGILGGVTYAFDWKGKDNNGKDYDVPLLGTFPLEQAVTQTTAVPQVQQSQNPQSQQMPQTAAPQSQIPSSSQNPSSQTQKPTIESLENKKQQNLPLPQVPTQAQPKKVKLPLSLILETTYAGDQESFGSLGIGGGVKIGYSENIVNVSITGLYQRATAGNTTTVTDPVSPAGIYGQTITDRNNYQSIGGDVALHLGKDNVRGVLDFGASLESYLENSTVQILRGNTILSSNNSSEVKSDVFLRGALGIESLIGEYDFGLEYSVNTGKVYPFIFMRAVIGQPSEKDN